MASGDSFSRASVARPREGGHSQAALHRCAHACPDEMKFGCAQLGDSAGDILEAYYGKINRGTPVPPLSHFFSGSQHIVGGTLDGPSSDLDDALVDLPGIYAVTEETPSGVYIRLAQENEELNNWTSVPRYSAVIADV
ncbi:hypothetical protein CDL15_Pgr002719 [Punica granatum]|uniref:Uncharacterized protein n=1 Tax=Punica granatum TaxID=22663 RepID=A0A218W2H4_PUNGR|nr:hypothetical protein CDL15_Pgr002719 [Punica granatum]